MTTPEPTETMAEPEAVPPIDPTLAAVMTMFSQMQAAQEERQERREAERETRAQQEREEERRRYELLLSNSRPVPAADPFEKIPTFGKMTNNSDITLFLTGFEAHMQNYSIPKDQWARRLLPSLSDKVMKAYNRVAADERRNYDSIKRAIEREFHIRPLQLVSRHPPATFISIRFQPQLSHYFCQKHEFDL